MIPEAPQSANRGSFATLRRFVVNPPRLERCGICSVPVPDEHAHLVDLDSRSLVCACRACAVLFSGQVGTRYKCVPRSLRRLPEMQLDEAAWDALSIPINMAFLFYNSRAAKPVAVYPSPAGAIESSISGAAWEDLVASSPAVRAMEPDVEALLVNRLPASGPEYYIAPIDECHRLVGIVRVHWRGMAGGSKVWLELEQYFADLRRRTPVPVAEVSHA